MSWTAASVVNTDVASQVIFRGIEEMPDEHEPLSNDRIPSAEWARATLTGPKYVRIPMQVQCETPVTSRHVARRTSFIYSGFAYSGFAVPMGDRGCLSLFRNKLDLIDSSLTTFLVEHRVWAKGRG